VLRAQFLRHTLVHETKKCLLFQDEQMVLLPFFDISSDFRLGKIPQECPFLKLNDFGHTVS